MDDYIEIAGTRLLVCGEDGPRLQTSGDINMFLSEAWAANATMIAIPVARLGDDFFQLRSGLAGEVAQKFVNYQIRVAIVGDISHWLAASKALTDFVFESNRGQALWFADNINEVQKRLAAHP